jgi:hypothetical protein
VNILEIENQIIPNKENQPDKKDESTSGSLLMLSDVLYTALFNVKKKGGGSWRRRKQKWH